MFADKTTARIAGVSFIVATLTAIVGGALQLYGLHLDTVVRPLFAEPVAVYEMVLAVRLISRGFGEPAVLDASSARG